MKLTYWVQIIISCVIVLLVNGAALYAHMKVVDNIQGVILQQTDKISIYQSKRSDMV